MNRRSAGGGQPASSLEKSIQRKPRSPASIEDDPLTQLVGAIDIEPANVDDVVYRPKLARHRRSLSTAQQSRDRNSQLKS